MHRLIIAFFITIVPMIVSSSYADEDGDGASVHVGGIVRKFGQYSYLSEKESLAELLNRVGGIPVTLVDMKKYQSGEPVPHVRVILYRNGKKQEYRIDPMSRQLWDLKVQKNDVIEVVRDPLYFGDFSSTLKLSKPNSGEQVVDGKPPEAPQPPR